jgi:hypothetical protein
MALAPYRGLLLALAAVPLFSCGAMRQLKSELGDLLIVRAKVAQKLNQEGVKSDGVAVNSILSGNDRSLIVSIVNSPLKAESTERKQNVAREVADIAYRAYNSRSGLKSVRVTFMISHSYLGIFHYSDSRDGITFPVWGTPQFRPTEAPQGR